MGKQITINDKRLKKGEVQKFISEGAVFEPSKTDILAEGGNRFVNIYSLKDGNYLFEFSKNQYGLAGKGDIWPQKYVDNWISRIARAKERKINTAVSNVEYWFQFSKSKNNFPNRINELKECIFETLNIDPQKFNYSYKSLDLLSDVLNALGDEYVEENLLDELVVYIGEVIRRRVKGGWHFNQRSFANQQKIMPLILNNAKTRYYDPISPIWEDLLSGQPFDLKSSVMSEVRRQDNRFNEK